MGEKRTRMFKKDRLKKKKKIDRVDNSKGKR